MKHTLRRVLWFFLFISVPVVMRASTIAECMTACAIWKWGPSQVTPTVIDRQPEQAGIYNGHSGTFVYQDLYLTFAPYLWYSLSDYSGTGTMGNPVETGSQTFYGGVSTVGGTTFDWIDANNQLQIDIVTPPVKTNLDPQVHSVYLWQCEQGITPPDNAVPYPEPSSLLLCFSGAIGLAVWRKLKI